VNILIGIVIGILALGGVYEYGHHVGYQERDAETIVQVDKINAENQQKTNNLVQQVADKDAELQKEKDNAKSEIAKRDTAIATGKLRLYVKTTSNTNCPNAPTTSGSDTATAELDPKTAESLVHITDEGDTAIRKLNACIAVYNTTREMINGLSNTK
jgi:prophage endopeptidase